MESIERLLFESFWSKFQPLCGGCWRSLGQCWSYLSSPRGSLGDNEPNLPPGDLPATPCNPKYPSQRQGKAEMFGRTLSRTFYHIIKKPRSLKINPTWKISPLLNAVRSCVLGLEMCSSQTGKSWFFRLHKVLNPHGFGQGVRLSLVWLLSRFLYSWFQQRSCSWCRRPKAFKKNSRKTFLCGKYLK